MISLEDKELLQLFDTFQKTRQQIVERLRSHGGPVTSSYTFTEGDRTDVSLDELFGDRSDLLVIHNMGRHCRWCTLWADGLNGLLDHMEARTAVVLVNGDEPSSSTGVCRWSQLEVSHDPGRQRSVHQRSALRPRS